MQSCVTRLHAICKRARCFHRRAYNNQRHIATGYELNWTRSWKDRAYNRPNYWSKWNVFAHRYNGSADEGNRLIGRTTRDLLVCTAGRKHFLAAEENEGGETNKRPERKTRGEKLSPVSYCTRIRSSCERKSMKSRMRTKIDFKKTGSREFTRGRLDFIRFY